MCETNIHAKRKVGMQNIHGLHKNILFINVPIILIGREVIFTKHIIGDLEGFFARAKNLFKGIVK